MEPNRNATEICIEMEEMRNLTKTKRDKIGSRRECGKENFFRPNNGIDAYTNTH